MSSRGLVLLAVALVAAAVAAVGCGSSGADNEVSTSTAATVPTIDKAEFVRRANAACRQKRAGLKQRVARFERLRAGKKPTPYTDLVHFVYLPTIEEEMRGIETAGRPVGEKERLRIMLAAERAALDAVAVMPHVASIKVAQSHFGRSRRMFRAYGLDACVIGG